MIHNLVSILNKNGIQGRDIKKTSRHLSDMEKFFQDRVTARKNLKKRNPLLYEVYEHPVPLTGEHLIYALTVLYPGRIGKEFFMTKGHFHKNPDGAEVVIGIKGKGYFLLQDRKDHCIRHPVKAQDILYVLPGFAHRAVNNTNKKFIFLSLCSAAVGHDYETIEKTGFNFLLKRIKKL